MKNWILLAFMFIGCADTQTKNIELAIKEDKIIEEQLPIQHSASQILELPQVPVLCYHQIKNWKGNESRLAKDVVVPPAIFKAQIKILADSGYQTILPDDLYEYLTKGKQLPAKPVMITFDDSDADQYYIAAPELERYGFKGVYFLMTVSLGRSKYMSKDQVVDLANRGHSIGLHTWDHHNVTKYTSEDWPKQIGEPARFLEKLIGKPVEHFAYPFGAWNKEAIPNLKTQGMKTAFQLSTVRDSTEPLHTIRRMIVPGDWTANSMVKAMSKTFK